MTTAREFLDFWIENSVHSAENFGVTGASQTVPELVKRCIEMGYTEGITETDFQAEVGDLNAFIAAKLLDANNAERARLVL